MSYDRPDFITCIESDFFGLEIHMDCSCMIVSNSDSKSFYTMYVVAFGG